MPVPDFTFYEFAGLNFPLPSGLNDKTLYEFSSQEHALSTLTLEVLHLAATHAPNWLANKRERFGRVPGTRVTKIQRSASAGIDTFGFDCEFLEGSEPQLIHLSVACYPEFAVAVSSSGAPEHRALLPKILRSIHARELPPLPVDEGYRQHVVHGLRIAIPGYLRPPRAIYFERRDLRLVACVGAPPPPSREGFGDVGVSEEAQVLSVQSHPRELSHGALHVRGSVDELELEFEGAQYKAAVAQAVFTFNHSVVGVSVRAAGQGILEFQRWWRPLLERSDVVGGGEGPFETGS